MGYIWITNPTDPKFLARQVQGNDAWRTREFLVKKTWGINQEGDVNVG